jgi:hypothetical protein
MDKNEFDTLCEQWHTETGSRSDLPTDHPAFQKIITVGKNVLPWIFNRIMFDDRNWWCLLVSDICSKCLSDCIWESNMDILPMNQTMMGAIPNDKK